MKSTRPALAVAALLCAAGAAAEPAAEAGSGEREAQLPLVVVTDSRTDLKEVLSPGVVSVAYPDDVKGEHKSIPDLLDQIPGVYVRRMSGSGHYTTASIRGSAPSQVNVYIDGVPLNTASETAADLSTLPVSNVERVEVYRGVTPARFSGAPIGGAINIVTRKPSALTGSAAAGRRSLGGEQYSANLNFPLFGGHMLIGVDKERSTGGFNYKNYAVDSLNTLVIPADRTVVAGSDPRGSGITGNPHTWGVSGKTYTLNVPVDRTRMNNGSEKQNVLLKWQDERFTVKFAQTEMERGLPNSIPATISYDATRDLPGLPLANFNPRATQNLLQQEGLLGWRNSFGDLGASLNLSWLDKNSQYRKLDLLPAPKIGEEWTNYRTRRYGVAGDLIKPFGTGSGLEHLVELHAERYEETLYSDISKLWPTSDFIREFRRTKTNLQVQDTMTVAALGGLQVTPIFRLEKLEGPAIGSTSSPLAGASADDRWSPTGSLSLKKNFAGGWQLFGSYGTYNRYPNFYEIYGNGLGLKPGTDSVGHTDVLVRETGVNRDLGVGWDGRLSEKLRSGLRLTYFQREAKDAITLLSTPVAARYLNYGDTRTRGLELEGSLAWSERFDLQFAATWQDAYYVDGGWFYYPGRTQTARYAGEKSRVRYIPQAAVSARLNMYFLGGDLTTYVEGQYTGRTYTDVTVWENPLTTFNFGAHYKIAKGWKLSSGVIDAFNAGPRQTLGGAGRTPASYQWRDSGYAACASLPAAQRNACRAAHQHTEKIWLENNVQYPQQGRTLYATLAYSF